MNLQDIVATYARHRDSLIKIYNKVDSETTQLSSLLRENNAEAWENEISLKQIESKLRPLGIESTLSPRSSPLQSQKPSIAFVGKTKSGKSSLINLLLKEKVVAQYSRLCTARLTRITYSPTHFVHLISGNGQPIEQYDNLRVIPTSLQRLRNTQDRRDPIQTSVGLRFGFPSSFLECGIDLIDSPGHNENQQLERLSKQMVENLLPMIIYVIQGQNSVTEKDILTIREIKLASPHLKILYYVSFLNISQATKSTNPNINIIEQANKKLDITFNTLQLHGFIPKTENRATCMFFHGSDKNAVEDYRTGTINDITSFFIKQFQKMESSLVEFINSYLRTNILGLLTPTINHLERYLDKLIGRARSIQHDKTAQLDEIKKIKRTEKDLHNCIITLLVNKELDIKERIFAIIGTKLNEILQPLDTLEYPRELKLSFDGVVTDPDQHFHCCKAVYKTVAASLDTILAEFVEHEIFWARSSIAIEIMKQIEDLYRDTAGRTSFLKVLENQLCEAYDYNNLIFQRETNFNSKTSLKLVFQNIKTIVQGAFSSSRSPMQRVCVHQAEWKRNTATDKLNSIDRNKFSQSIFKVIVDDVNAKHIKFEQSLREMERGVIRDCQLPDITRQNLVSMAPSFADLHLSCLDMRGIYEIPDSEFFQVENSSIWIHKFNDVTKKLVCRSRKFLRTEREQIAIGVYYSSILKHCHILSPLSIRLIDKDENDQLELKTFFYFKEWTMLEFLKTSRPIDLRFKLSLQLLEAVRYLHRQGFSNRDIKFTNIFIGVDPEDEYRAFLVDDGTFHCDGLAQPSIEGKIPICMAPESIGESVFDKSADIFALGSILWFFLVSEKGANPAGAELDMESGEVVWADSVDLNQIHLDRADGPERTTVDLFNECCYYDRKLRPTIEDLIVKVRELQVDLVGG